MPGSPYSTKMAFDATQNVRCLIADDDVKFCNHLRMLLRYAFPNIIIVGHCASVKELMPAVIRTKPDLLLLDIHLSDGESFETLQQFDTDSMDIIIVSACENPKNIRTAIRCGIADYLLKPFVADEFTECINTVLRKRVRRLKRTFIAAGAQVILKTCAKTIISLDPHSITRLEAKGKCTEIVLADGTAHRVVGTLSDTLALLPQEIFYQTHRSFAVNLRYVTQARNYFAFLTTGDRVEVSIRVWARFVAAFREYCHGNFCEV